jgi:hypothetical protein
MKTINKNKDYKVHPDDIDVRGWNFVVDNTKVGTVNDLIVDESKSRVKYLDVLRKDRRDETDYHYLISMNEVVFDRHNKYVNLEGNSHHFIERYPRFSNEIPSDYEERIRNYYSETKQPEYSGKEYSNYEDKQYPDERAYEERAYEDKSYEEYRANKEHLEEIRIAESRESPFGKDYERLDPDKWEERINMLEKQKQIKKLELERDMAIIDKEIMQIRAKYSK